MENGGNSPATCNNNDTNGDSNAGTNGDSGKIPSNGDFTPYLNSTGSIIETSNELPAPRCILYPRENVQIGWNATGRQWHVGVGMINVGNTCYLNSILQALFHIPSIINWLISDNEHMEICSSINAGCIICAMAKTLEELQCSQTPIRPSNIYTRLHTICKHLTMGHQEDAHEFLRYLIEAMEKSYLSRFWNYKELDQYSKETTPLNQILGGYLKSSVRCLSCNHVSVTFQHFQDLLLDIHKADTVDEALEGYFSRESLEDMGYKCEACKKTVSATKQFSLERAPIVLCIQLKRFSILGPKLNKPIAIKPTLDISRFASPKNPGEQLTYRLVSMVNHKGTSQNCGHYTAIGLTGSDTYYNYDDSYVRSISMQNVWSPNSYIIFYEMDKQSARNINTTIKSGAQNEEQSWNSKYSLDVAAIKRKTNNNKNNESSSDDDDDDENEILSSSTSSLTSTQATLPSMPLLDDDYVNTTSNLSSSNTLANITIHKSPAHVKSLVPYSSETDDEIDVCKVPNSLKRPFSFLNNDDDDDSDVDGADIKSSNSIKIRKVASSTHQFSFISPVDLSSSSSDSEDERNTSSSVVKTNSGIWQVTSLEPVASRQDKKFRK